MLLNYLCFAAFVPLNQFFTHKEMAFACVDGLNLQLLLCLYQNNGNRVNIEAERYINKTRGGKIYWFTSVD